MRLVSSDNGVRRGKVAKTFVMVVGVVAIVAFFLGILLLGFLGCYRCHEARAGGHRQPRRGRLHRRQDRESGRGYRRSCLGKRRRDICFAR